jgi:CD163 antigen
VCDDSIGKSEADVICRMLGYPHGSQISWWGPGSSSHTPNHSFGHGSGRILLDDLDCTGNEDSVVQCKHRPWGAHNCQVDGAKHEWLGITCLVSIF